MKKTLQILALNLVILLCGLGLIELFFGNWFGRDKLNQLNLVRNYTRTFNLGDLYPSGHSRIVYKRDSLGLRGEYPSPSKIDILTIGGSTTDQRYITEGETWQDRLRQEFMQIGTKLFVVNAGVDGQSSYGHIKNFNLWFAKIPDFRPRYILAYIGVNDLKVSANNNEYDLLRSDGLMSRLRNQSALYYLSRTLSGIINAKSGAKIAHGHENFSKVQWVRKPLENHHAALSSTQLDHYEQRLRILDAKIRAMGALPIFVTQTRRDYRLNGTEVLGSADISKFNGRDVNGVDYYFLMKLLNARTISVCRSLKAICLDLANELELEDTDYYDFVHNTPSGARKIGNYLFRKLRNQTTH